MPVARFETAPAPPRPNLFLIGAMKSGTTTLAEYLDRHPAIAMADPKEPCYFVDPEDLKRDWPTMWARRYWADEAAYLALFDAGSATRYLGDASTAYAKCPDIEGVAERIAAYAPEARILYIMRDPTVRAISHYWHAFRAGGEARPLDKAIRAGPSPYLAYGRYAAQLDPYLRCFGREQVLPLVAERLSADPVGEVNRVFAWLGLPPLPPEALPALHAHATPALLENPALQNRLYRSLRADWLNPVKRLIPTGLKAGVKTRLGGAVPREAVDTAALQAKLRRYYAPEIERLAARLDDPLPEWPRHA